ncbi:MAG: deoxyribodipyrimidine photo-lyase [Anaerolineae bacterium]|nr:deoxyribodipyrimidine photo-lyase [Anaerolineae bacterium]
MEKGIWWIRRDLRLSDNETLSAALRNAEQVLPVFILDPALLQSPYMSERRLTFLLGGLSALDTDLRARGSALIVRQGRPVEVLTELQAETGAEAIFAEADVSPYARRRDAEVVSRLALRLHGGLTIMPPNAVHRQDGAPYTVFTPFSRAWKSLSQPTLDELESAPARIPTPPGITGICLESENLKPVNTGASEFPPGEKEAQQRLERFMEHAVCAYATDRDRMDRDGTSKLSPYLRFGMLSARQAAATVIEARRHSRRCDDVRGAETWLNEILWREFYSAILYHFPHVRQGSFRPAFDAIRWRNDPEEFRAWQEGRTGYPVVDAAMRQLHATGWMHNRARMIVASFLTKDLLIDWRWGERYFMEQLLDGDPASNNGGWQWAAGTGTDAAPYFRIFNPVLQGEKFDPDGATIRRWVPELQRAPAADIHRPWTMSEELQREIGCMIGRDYPTPIVDHSMARERTLAAYKAAKG